MYQPPVRTSSKTYKSRLGLKIAGLFLGVFLAVFSGLFFFDLLRALGETAIVDAANSNPRATAAIDPKLETELAKVLENTDSQTTADIRNPFADTGGISSGYNAPNVSRAPVSNGGAKTVSQPGGGQVAAQKNQTPPTIPGRNVPTTQNVVNAMQPQIDTRARLQLREERLRLGIDAGPEAAVFAIDDLLPVGVVAGGDGKDEVLFYSESACRVVSFPVGTQFFDGWFDSTRQEGVVFGFFDRYRTKRMRAWGRSVNRQCSQPQPQQGLWEQISPDRASTTGAGGD